MVCRAHSFVYGFGFGQHRPLELLFSVGQDITTSKVQLRKFGHLVLADCVLLKLLPLHLHLLDFVDLLPSWTQEADSSFECIREVSIFILV